MEFLVATVGKGFDYAVEEIKLHSKYMFGYRKNVQNLKKEMESLKKESALKQRSIDAAKRKGEEIEPNVEKWLEDVKSKTNQAAEHYWHDEEEEAKKKCFFNIFPNLSSRYLVSKKMLKEANSLAELLKEGQSFVMVSHQPELDIPATLFRRYEASESRNLVLNQIFSAVTDANVDFIGIYGPPGVGKSTLVKEVAKQAGKEKKLFDAVVIAVVTRRLDIRRIQGQIADFLGLKFDEESEFGRAARLHKRMSKEKSVLVILDDVWETVNLEEVGIPFGDDCKGCKILLTSRFLQVLHQMGSQKQIEVSVLREDEAWNLFKRTAGDDIENPELQLIAAEVCKKCGGLPIAIVTAARALRKSTLSEWKYAREHLTDPYGAVELAVKHLKSEELKSAFLLCSLMPQNALTFDLLKYGMGLNLFRGNVTMEEARKRLSPLLQNLKSSYLLLESDTKDEFAMHDYVRDAAALIAKRRGWLRGLDDSAALRSCRGLSLSHDDLRKFPKDLELPQLKFLRIQNEDPSFKVPDDLFSRMRALEVLDSTGIKMPKLPSSLGVLENLQTLCLESCVLDELAGIAELKKLQILSFYKSVLEKLPEEIGELAQLKLLNFNNCSQLQVIPPNVIARLPHLEELYMGNSFTKWEPEGHSDQVRRNVSIAELKNLTSLTALDMHIPDSHIIPNDLFFEKLNRYNISIGDVSNLSGKHDSSRALKLKLNESIHLHHGIKMLLKKTEDLYLDELKGVKNLVYELDGEGFPQLKYLHVRNSMEIRYIVNATEPIPQNAFPTLELLVLESLINLEKICHGQLTSQSFQKLRTIKVQGCNKLKNLLLFSMVKVLPQLEEIEVTDCKNMVEIVSDEHDASDKIELSQLQSLTLHSLPQLISFYTKERRNSVALFHQELLLPNLESLKLSLINATKIWHDQLPVMCSCIKNLSSMTVERCDGLKYIFHSSMVSNLVQLKHLEIIECKMIEEIIFVEEIPREERMQEIVFPNLHTLKIKGLQNLSRFCSGDYVQFPSLKQLQIEHCPELKTFIFKSKQESHSGLWPLFDRKVAFPHLKIMMISHLKSFKMLWHNQLHAESFNNLKTMEIEHCEELLEIFPSNLLDRFHGLEMLILDDCKSVKQVFDLQGPNGEVQTTVTPNHQLKKLRIHRLPKLKRVWNQDPNGIITFQNLNSVDIFDCESLENVFPPSVARDLSQLEKLEIDTCLELKEVVSKGEEPEVETRFEFPRLSFLKLWHLPELKSFYPGIHSIQCPMLKKLKTYHCDQTKIFTLEVRGLRKMQQPFLLIEQVLPHLEEVSLDSKFISVLIQRQFPANVFNNITRLQVHCFHQESEMFPLNFLQNFHNLENLDLGCCRFKHLFTFEGTKALPQVKNLKLVALPNLSQIWKEGSRPDLLLPNLESLLVWQSRSLTRIFPSLASFENLRILDIWRCEGVTHIVTSSTAKSLIQLIKMSIRECSMVTEIVADEEGQEQEEEVITFSSLKCLELQSLPSVINFSSGNCGFSFPALEDVTVQQCPNLVMFSWGSLSTPKLKRIWVTEDKDQGYWKGDLNATFYHSSGQIVSDATDRYLEEHMASYSIEGDH